ncbi:MAG: hypothetical protein LBH20_03515, partial [Treponema sp.]|nr:hypothetical protein [Treponema sp.]
MRNKTSLWLIAAVFAAAGFLITSCPEVVEALISLPLTGKVSIEGVPQVGETLTANTSELGGSGAISYQWNRMQGLNKVPIGSNSSTYIVQEEDVGSMINVTVSRFDNIGTVTNWQIVFVTSPLFNPRLNGSVSIEGTPEVGQTLTANTASLGGSGTISYQWKRNYITNVGTGVETYTLTSEDKLSVITVSVERKGNSGSVTSRQTSIITNPSDPRLTGTVSIEGPPEVGQTLTANTASLGGSGTISYQWKRGVDIGLNIGINTDNGVYVGENSSTYTVQKADLGYLITVTVTRAN